MSIIFIFTCGCGAPAQNVSVKPGINDSYRNVASAEPFIERFETESREIFRLRSEIVGSCGIRPGDSVADVGAGTGLFTVLFAEAAGPNGKVFAVDIVPEFLRHIAERAVAAGHNTVQTVQCSDNSANLPADSVDVVFICDTYHHFEYPSDTMATIHTSMRSGGRLIVIDFERIPGESRDWVLGHVRAGRDVVVGEITAAGFERMPLPSNAPPLLENYMVVFKKK